MEPLKNIRKIIDDLKTNRLKPSLVSSLSVPLWEEIVGKPVAAHSKPVSFKNKSLLVICDSSVWCNELESHKSSILEKTTSILGSTIIKEIKLVVKRVPKSSENLINFITLPKLDERKFAWAESVAMEVPKPIREAFLGAIVGSIISQQKPKNTFDKLKKPHIKGAGGFK